MGCLKKIKDSCSVYMKKNWAYFLIGLIILIFTIQITLYYATFKNLDWGWFPELADKEWLKKDKDGNIIDDGLEGKWGVFGDFIGGILNPILGFITIILLLISHQKDNERDYAYHKQREIDLFLSRLEALKENQSNYIQNIRMIKKNENESVDDYVVLGNLFFSLITNLINRIYQEIKSKIKDDEYSLIVAYLIIYHGRNIYFKNFHCKYNHLIKDYELNKIISEVMPELENRYGLVLFSGLKTQLSSYFRRLYHIMGVIENSKIISEKEKYELSKDLRVQMSPQEQMLLLINTLTENGNKWNTKGYCVIFKLFRNVNINENFKGVDLEKIINKKIDDYLFENSDKLHKYLFKDKDIEEFKKNYFELL